MKRAIIFLALLASAPAMAQVALTPQGYPDGDRFYAEHAAQSRHEMNAKVAGSTCQRDGGPEYPCHICYRGTNAYDMTEYECSAAEEARQERAIVRRAR